MPLYDYGCADGHDFEVFVSISDLDKPVICDCGKKATRFISAPALKLDKIEPTLGADGKMHDSLTSYRASLKADGNPQRQNYAELGDAKLEHVTYEFDKKQRREDIKRAIADVKYGRVPVA